MNIYTLFFINETHRYLVPITTMSKEEKKASPLGKLGADIIQDPRKVNHSSSCT